MATFQPANRLGFVIKGDTNPDDQPEGWIVNSVFGAGPLQDVLFMEGNIVVASGTSGVWDTGLETDSFPISLQWDRAGINCLWPRRRSTLGKTGDPGFPALSWRRIPIVNQQGDSLNSGAIRDMTIMSDDTTPSPILALACDNGLFLAMVEEFKPIEGIPQGLSYLFFQPVDSSGQTVSAPFSAVSGVSLGLSRVTVAAQPGVGAFIVTLELSTTPFFVLTKSVIPAEFEAPIGLTALAHAENSPGIFYAAAVDSSDNLYFVLRGEADNRGNLIWTPTTAKVLNSTNVLFRGDGQLAGTLAADNKRMGLAVSPTDPNTVFLGWQSAYFILTGSGDHWIRIDASTTPLYAGIHAFEFDRSSPPTNYVYICSDGGIVSTPNMGRTHDSPLNQSLPNLEVHRLAVHEKDYGIVAGSVSNWGTLYCSLYPNPQNWKVIREGRGQAVVYLRDGQLLDQIEAVGTNSTDVGIEGWRLRYFALPTPWQEPDLLLTNTDSIALLLEAESTPLSNDDGFRFALPVEPVYFPSYRYPFPTPGRIQDLFGAALVGLAATGDSKIYGLWRGVDDNQVIWDTIGGSFSNGEQILCLASADGSVIFAGTNQGAIYQFDAPVSADAGWKQRKWAIDGAPEQVRRICAVPGAAAMALTSSSVSGGGIFILNAIGTIGAVWGPLTPTGSNRDQYTSIETDWSPTSPFNTIFVSTDNEVFASTDLGVSWNVISAGLPTSPHITDLRFVQEPAGATYLYVATFGWSIWRLQLSSGSITARTVTTGGKNPDGQNCQIDMDNGNGGQSETALQLISTLVDSASIPVNETSYFVRNTPENALDGSKDLWASLTTRFELQADGSVQVHWLAFAHPNSDPDHEKGIADSVLTVLGPGEEVQQLASLANVNKSANFSWMIKN